MNYYSHAISEIFASTEISTCFEYMQKHTRYTISKFAQIKVFSMLLPEKNIGMACYFIAETITKIWQTATRNSSVLTGVTKRFKSL